MEQNRTDFELIFKLLIAAFVCAGSVQNGFAQPFSSHGGVPTLPDGFLEKVNANIPLGARRGVGEYTSDQVELVATMSANKTSEGISWGEASSDDEYIDDLFAMSSVYLGGLYLSSSTNLEEAASAGRVPFITEVSGQVLSVLLTTRGDYAGSAYYILVYRFQSSPDATLEWKLVNYSNPFASTGRGSDDVSGDGYSSVISDPIKFEKELDSDSGSTTYQLNTTESAIWGKTGSLRIYHIQY